MIKDLRHIAWVMLCVVACITPHVCAARPAVKAKLDSVNILMGRMATLTLTVDMDKNAGGSFPIFSQLRENGIIPVCNDSVELRAPSKIDTVVNGNSMTVTYHVPVQSFDSGYYKLPEFIFVSGKDSVKSNSLALKVYPVVAQADTPIDDYAGVADPAEKSVFDNIPDWLYNYWWIFLIVILFAGVGLYLLKKYRKDKTLFSSKPEPDAYEVAANALAALKGKKLWEQGMEKEYFTELTEILRVYLFKRFGINAMEMTSREILRSLSENKELKDKRNYFRQILNMADFVKFAKVRPLPADNIEAYDNAVKFVEETKPVPAAENDKKDNETRQNDTDAKSGEIARKEDAQ
ncbi:MAG: BatD family protein [Candidatus Amulumruptor caecigallinarius]|nr:BatD family protein [Candidatus Amulumruptor caecigallinarius]